MQAGGRRFKSDHLHFRYNQYYEIKRIKRHYRYPGLFCTPNIFLSTLLSSGYVFLMEYVIALLLAYGIFRFLNGSILSLASIPEEIDPTDVLEVSQRFLCDTCGTEVMMELQSVVASEPPKHCKIEMIPLQD